MNEKDTFLRNLVLGGLTAATVYGVIGIIVAADRDYFSDLFGSWDNLFSAIGEVLFWPLVLVGIDITLR